ncbi:MAG: hypothetical protein BroJett003_26850 [Planctomycetota bacterium]|nr:MAG: hypothetical protein BroJett003_26850 [Planctomycetota bacterium]
MDERPWVVLLFHLRPPKDRSAQYEAELRESVERLNRLARARSDLVVVGVTPEKEEAVRRFIGELRVEFPIGVRSTAHRALGVSRFPAIIRFEKGASLEEVSLSRLSAYEMIPLPDGESSIYEWSTDRIMELLRSQKGEGVDGELTDEALEILSVRIDTEEFIAFCDEIEPLGLGAPAWVGRVRYHRHLADPTVEQKQPPASAAAEALADYRSSSMDPKWATYNMVASRIENITEWSPSEAMQIFNDHLSTSPNDLLIRHALAAGLRRCGDKMLSSLRSMIDKETDAIIKTRLILSLIEASPPADTATLEFIELQLQTESNIRWVRPTLEFARDRIRTKGKP